MTWKECVKFSSLLLCEKAINIVDPVGGLMIDAERINRQFSLSHEKVVVSCVDPGGINNH